MKSRVPLIHRSVNNRLPLIHSQTLCDTWYLKKCRSHAPCLSALPSVVPLHTNQLGKAREPGAKAEGSGQAKPPEESTEV